MDYCKYHPLTASTYHCDECDISQCDHCIDDDVEHNDVRCFVCGGTLSSLGSGADVAPFWRRLDSAFHYPMNKQALMLIIVASVLTSLGAFLGGLIGLAITLLTTAALMKYSFLCLQSTADGEVASPDANEAFSGGIKIIVHTIIILFGITAMVIAMGRVFGDMPAALFSIFWLICLPAVFINYARFEAIGPALNPIEVGRLVVTLGGAYLLLLLFIMIMIASVGTINQILDERFYFFSAILQSVVSYYYLIVIFHLMGYLIFQKQRALGFVSRMESSADSEVRNDRALLTARIEVLAKEGEFNQVLKAFNDGIKKHPNDYGLYTQFFDFLWGTKDLEGLDGFLPGYLSLLKEQGRQTQGATVYQRILLIDKDYVPKQPDLRYQLARSCFEAGKMKLVLKLINGLHRDCADYEQLIPAYQLMADALDQIPTKGSQAEKCRQLIRQLEANPSC